MVVVLPILLAPPRTLMSNDVVRPCWWLGEVFVGLVIPHAVRLMAGASHRRVIPLSLLFGGAFLALADVVARTVQAPAELAGQHVGDDERGDDVVDVRDFTDPVVLDKHRARSQVHRSPRTTYVRRGAMYVAMTQLTVLCQCKCGAV